MYWYTKQYGTEKTKKWRKRTTSKFFDSLIISKLIKTKNNFKYLIGDLHEVIGPLVLILSKMSRYIKIFNNKNNKLMCFRIDDDKLLEKYKTIQTKVEYLKILN